jgi:phosphohistidine phosphatase SixA
MRYIIILSLLCCVACEQPLPVKEPIPLTEDSTFLTGTFFLVRHAEQIPGYDSSLTTAGFQRAGELYRFLKDSGIQKIYVTPFLSSIETADSLREYLQLDTASYKADSTGEGLIYEITRRDDWGKRLLIIGHDYTLPPVMKSLKAKPPVDSIGYADLFIVRKFRDSVKMKKFIYSNMPSISANATEK